MEVGFWGGIHRTRVAVCGGAAWAFMAGGEGLLVRRSVWARVPQRAPHARTRGLGGKKGGEVEKGGGVGVGGWGFRVKLPQAQRVAGAPRRADPSPPPRPRRRPGARRDRLVGLATELVTRFFL